MDGTRQPCLREKGRQQQRTLEVVAVKLKR